MCEGRCCHCRHRLPSQALLGQCRPVSTILRKINKWARRAHTLRLCVCVFVCCVSRRRRWTTWCHSPFAHLYAWIPLNSGATAWSQCRSNPCPGRPFACQTVSALSAFIEFHYSFMSVRRERAVRNVIIKGRLHASTPLPLRSCHLACLPGTCRLAKIMKRHRENGQRTQRCLKLTLLSLMGNCFRCSARHRVASSCPSGQLAPFPLSWHIVNAFLFILPVTLHFALDYLVLGKYVST